MSTRALVDLAAQQHEAGRRDEALTSLDEAIARLRGAATVDLARALNHRSIVLLELRRLTEAEADARDAAGVFRALGERAGLAMALHNHANALRELARRAEAQAAARESVGLYVALAGDAPEAFALHLTSALRGLAATVDDAAGHAMTLRAADDAAACAWPLVERDARTWGETIATLLGIALDQSDALRRAPPASVVQRAARLKRLLGR